MKCNKCWKSLENEVAFITTCSHMFCESDARKAFTKDKCCPVCDTSLSSRSSITGVELVSDDSKVLPLCGLSPKDILEISSKAISFWSFQKQLELEYCRADLKKKDADILQIEKNYNDKMLEAANQINTTKHRMNAMKEEMERDKVELKELKEKYEEKSRQKRKLEELYDALKHKSQEAGITVTSPTTSSFFNSPPKPSAAPSSPGSFKAPKSPRDRFALLRRNSPSSQPSHPSSVSTPVIQPRLLPSRNLGDGGAVTPTHIGPSLPLLQKPATPLFAKRASSLVASI